MWCDAAAAWPKKAREKEIDSSACPLIEVKRRTTTKGAEGHAPQEQGEEALSVFNMRLICVIV